MIRRWSRGGGGAAAAAAAPGAGTGAAATSPRSRDASDAVGGSGKSFASVASLASASASASAPEAASRGANEASGSMSSASAAVLAAAVLASTSSNNSNNAPAATTRARKVELDAVEDAVRREMTRRNGSPARVAQLVRTELLFALRDDLRLPAWRFVLGVHPLVPKPNPALAAQLRAAPRDLPNQRVITVDVERTRVDLPEFRTAHTHDTLEALLTHFCRVNDVRYRQGLNELLAPFLWLHRSSSPAGTGELDALLPKDTEPSAFETWSAFMARFLPHVYSKDDEMYALQSCFRLFELLLGLHDPELRSALDRAGLRPELYASSWFMTLFAQSVPLDALLKLWDHFVFGDEGEDALTTVGFVGVALLCANRAAFIRADASDLPVMLTSGLSYHRRQATASTAVGSNGSAESATAAAVVSSAAPGGGRRPPALVLLSDELETALAAAAELRRRTPRAFVRDAHDALLRPGAPPNASVTTALEARPCVTMAASELVERVSVIVGESTTLTTAVGGTIVLVDVRDRVAFEQQRLISRGRVRVVSWSPDVVADAARIMRAVADLTDVRSASLITGAASPSNPMLRAPSLQSSGNGFFVCLVGGACTVSGFDVSVDEQTSAVLEYLSQRATTMPGVCVVEGGFDAIVEAARAVGRLDLISAVPGGASSSLPSSPRSPSTLSSTPSTMSSPRSFKTAAGASATTPPPPSGMGSGRGAAAAAAATGGGGNSSAPVVPISLVITRRPIGGG